jgi:ribosome-binding factor A
MKPARSASTPRASAPSQRMLRVGESVRAVLIQALNRGNTHDPRLEALHLTVTEVRMSPDLKWATALVSTLGGQQKPEALAALNDNAGMLRTQVAKAIRLKFAPQLRFVFDTRFDESAHIDTLLSSVPPALEDENA